MIAWVLLIIINLVILSITREPTDLLKLKKNTGGCANICVTRRMKNLRC